MSCWDGNIVLSSKASIDRCWWKASSCPPVVDLLAHNPDKGGGRAREKQLPHSFPDLFLIDGRIWIGHEESLYGHHPPVLLLCGDLRAKLSYITTGRPDLCHN